MATTDTHGVWRTHRSAGAQGDLPFSGDMRAFSDDDSAMVDPLLDAPKWAAWKVTVAVVVFCGAFWAGIGYLAVQLLG